MHRLRPLRTPAVRALLSLAALSAAHAQSEQPIDARALFETHCATCHGKTGDGQGVTQLDRPARSFKDGGFSFGNTVEALFRTISTGIPGTPMPGFDSALSEREREALAEYVRTLGPPIVDTETEKATLVVGTRPLVVRGHLPPVVADAPAYPRGLLLGTTSGLTFEYRADDVRLVAVRQGGFVRRTDWTGRGGTALEPLGRPVFVADAGDPSAQFRLDQGREPLSAKLRATTVQAGRVSVALEVDANGQAVAVHETVAAATAGNASGFTRSFEVNCDGAAELLADWLLPLGPEHERLELPGAADRTAIVYRAPDGLFQVVVLEGAAEHAGRVKLALAGSKHSVRVTTLLCSQWDADQRANVLKGIDSNER